MYDDLSKKILIVEDDLEYRNPLKDFLAARGYAVSTADEGDMAMEKLLFHKPHLVILDLLLPKLNGFEVLKRIRQYPDKAVANVPVIILSNLSGEQDLKQASEQKISGYFVKAHTNKEDILKKITETLLGSSNVTPEEVWDFTQH